MARRKTLPDLVKTKYSLAERLCRLRAELFGDRGGPELARRLNIPVRTWYNYEAGVTVPAEVVLRIIELTSVEPMWLLHGKGPKFRPKPIEDYELLPSSKRSVGSLLRTALQILEQGERSKRNSLGEESASPLLDGDEDGDGDEADDDFDDDDDVFIAVNEGDPEPITRSSGSKYLAARAEWFEAEQEGRRVLNTGDAMEPIVPDGASVVFTEDEEEPAALDGKLVVAWVQGTPRVRWFEVADNYALLRAESAEAEPAQILLDLDGEGSRDRVRRVLWINTLK